MSVFINNNYLVLEWGNSCDFGNILYQNGFVNRLYLDVDVANPSYPIEEEAQPDGNNDPHPVWQKWQKLYRFEDVVPEYMLDALTLIPMHDTIYISLKSGEAGKVKEISISEPDWDETLGHLARVTIEFSFDSIIKTACCENFDLAGCYEPNLTNIQEIIDVTDAKFTDPLGNGVNIGEFYLVTNTISGVDQTAYMQYTATGWENQNGAVYLNRVENLDDSEVYWCRLEGAPDNSVGHWVRYRTVTASNPVAGTVTLTGFALPDTFIRSYYRKQPSTTWLEFASPVLSSIYESDGVTRTGLSAGTYDFKVECYTHSCDYGEEILLNEVIT
jgi:hypothetical protein